MKGSLGKVIVVLAILLMFGLASADTGMDLTTGEPAAASAAASAAVPLCIIDTGECGALWDISHGVYLNYQPSQDYSDFVALLNSQGYPVAVTSTGILTEDLSSFEILIIAVTDSWNSAYTPAEVTAIQNFVNSGGKLLIMGENPGCPNVNVNPVSQAFGTTLGLSYMGDPTIFDAAYPAFSGVSAIQFAAGGELSSSAPSTVVAWDSSNKPAAAAVGKDVFIIADTNMFANNYIGSADNEKMVLNLWDKVFCEVEIPEFPTLVVPVTMIIGFLGAVLLVHRVREH